MTTPLPTPASRKRPDTYSDERDAFDAALPVFQEEMNDLGTVTSAAAASAAAAEAAAISAKNAAIAISGATVYSGVASYDYPDAVIGSDGNTYRCLGAGVSGDDPVGSITGNWHAITPVAPDFLSFDNLFLMGA